MPDAPRVPRSTSAQQERRRLLADASIGEGPEDYDPAVVPPAWVAGAVGMVSKTHPPRPRPADTEQIRLALVLHRSECTPCQAGQKCDPARRLEKALGR